MVELSVPAGVDADDPAYVENPVTGERFRFHGPPDDPSSDPLVFDCWATPGMRPVGTHVHPRQDETFTVNEGYLRVLADGAEETADPGESVTVPAGTPHTWEPTGDHEIHLTIELAPGLGAESFLRDLAALAREGVVGDDGVPSLLQVAAIYDAYGYDVMYLASPPLSVQRVVFGALAPVARGLGYAANPVAAREA